MTSVLTDPPYLTREQMVEVDRAMIEDLHIDLVQMMENAGRHLAHLARSRFLGGDPRGKRVVALAGPGGNGGGALVAARRLHGWGAWVEVVLARPEELGAVPARQVDILERMGVPVTRAEEAGPMEDLDGGDLILDGLIGYSLAGAPRGTVANLIRWANLQAAPILALDTPSGIDATTGTVFSPAIEATATLALALPKAGLKAPGARRWVGELFLADIGVPPSVYAAPSLALEVAPLFAREEILRLR